MTDASWSRRRFVRDGSLWVASAALLGCKPEGAPGSGAQTSSPPPPRPPDPRVAEAPAPYGTVAPESTAAPAPSGAAASCRLTPDNIEGPYYRAGAPMRADLTDATTPGTPLVIRGRVTEPGCQAISRATLDVWQADRDGRYDNDGHAGDKLVLRGKLVTHDDGTFELRTIVPGRYLNGRQYRPAHVHVKVSAPGFQSLTTQLYFDGDPYNKVDPFIKSPLVMSLADEGKAKTARFDFALSRGLGAAAPRTATPMSGSRWNARRDAYANRASRSRGTGVAKRSLPCGALRLRQQTSRVSAMVSHTPSFRHARCSSHDCTRREPLVYAEVG